MKPLILALLLLLAGCGTVTVYDPASGKVILQETTLLKNVTFRDFSNGEWNGKRTVIHGGSSTVDDAAVQAITEGVVAGVLRGVKP